MADESVPIQTILCKGQVAGSVLSYESGGGREVSYWLGKDFWGRGIATRALALYLEFVPQRPIFSRAAHDNKGSIRVLEKNGFRRAGIEKGYAKARGEEIEEFRFILAR